MSLLNHIDFKYIADGKSHCGWPTGGRMCPYDADVSVCIDRHGLKGRKWCARHFDVFIRNFHVYYYGPS
jgi:hypothetical protein